MTYDAVVVGAGISGLTAAYRLSRQVSSLLLLEAGDRVGGLIQTIKQDGFTVEAGPNTFPSGGEAIVSLCDSLGIERIPASPQAKNRYIFFNGRLHKVPMSPLGLMTTPLLSPQGKFRVLVEPWQARVTSSDETIASFTRRRLGPEVLDTLVGPFVSGVYAGDPETLSLPAVFPKLAEWEATSGSLLKGALHAMKQARSKSQKRPKRSHQLLSLKEGMETLPNVLGQALPKGSLRLNSSVQSIQSQEGGFKLVLSDGETLTTRSVVLATPAWVTASLLETLIPAISNPLCSIPSVPLTVVHVGFRRETFPHPLDGFGFLTALSANMQLLGSVWASSLFPERAPENQVLLSCYLGGARYPEVASMSDTDVLQQTLEGLKTVFRQWNLEPTFYRMFRYERSIPQYRLGHTDRIALINSLLQDTPGLFLSGNYFHGVSLNDCIRVGTQTAEAVTQYLLSHPE